MIFNLFSDKDFNKKLIKLSLPATFQSLMLSLVAVSDALMLGGINQNAMSAVSLATQIQFIQNMVIGSAVNVTAVLGAQYWGKRDMKAMDKIFCLTLRLCAVVSILFFAAVMLFPRFLMTVFTDEPVLIEIGVKYLKIAGWSYLITGISQTYLSMMKVSEHASATAVISSLAVVLNIVFNAVLIFGLLGFPKFGIQGAAIATLTARIIELVVSFLICFKPNYLKPTFKGLFKRDKQLSYDFFKCMGPIFGSYMLWGVGFTAYNAFMGHMGVDAAAANSVAAVVRDLVTCLCLGLSVAGAIIVGNELGAGNLDKGKIYGQKVEKLSYICGLVSMALMFAVTPLILKFVRLSGGAQGYLFQMMIIMSVYMFGRAVNTIIINGVFYAGGDSFFDFYSLIACMWCVAVPLASLGTFVFHWPVWIVYSCTCLDEIGKIPWVMYHFRHYKWVKNLTRETV